MSLPPIERINLGHSQAVADKLRQGSAMVARDMPEVASMLNVAIDQIEALCDAIRAGEQLNITLREIIVDMGRGS